MNLWLVILLFVIGIVLIVKGGDFFVDASTWIAEAFGIPKFIVGATIVSFATTLPELLVSLFAATADKVEMSIGNAVGSVTANVGLIMAISIICIPAVVKRSGMLFKSVLLLAAAALLFLFSLNGSLGILESLVLIALFIVFLIENVRSAKKSMDAVTEERPKIAPKTLFINLAKFIVGAAGIVIGADLLVDNGSILAARLGIPESVIGVTLIAVGTSLPELVTTITAVVKKQSSLSIGNIIGANIIDLAIILPLCSLVSGGSIPVEAQSKFLDMPVCLLILLVALIPTLITQKFKRLQGVLLLGAYVAYLFVVCSGILV